MSAGRSGGQPAYRGVLVERARTVLGQGCSDAVKLVEYVFQQPRTPEVVADHLLCTLLGDHPGFVRASDGRWSLVHPADSGDAVANGGSPLAGWNPACASPRDHDQLRSLPWVVVDVETTGGRAQGDDRITEIAAVSVRDGEIAGLWESLVNPGRSIPPWITRLTNISWDMVADKPAFAELSDELLRAITGHVFVAHNAAFDWGFVSAEVRRATGAELTGSRLCTVRLARKLLPHLPRRSLDSVARYYGVEIEARHRAAGDALATARVLRRLLDDAADRGVATWGELDRFLHTSAPRRRRRSSLPISTDTDSSA